MPESTTNSYELAVRDFKRARKTAVLQQLLARLGTQSVDLLDYESTLQDLKHVGEPITHGITEIPLSNIVGSVGRFQDFTRDFLPKHDHDETRWASVKKAFTDMAGLPPIEVYQIGDAYFVLDGNHRVSVARQLGSKTITARVTEIKTRVPLSANDNIDALICKADYAKFLEDTALDHNFPDIDLLMSVCGQYKLLMDQINWQRKKLNDEQNTEERDVTIQEAASDWYRSVYWPVYQLINELGVLRRFPDHAAADIYVLLSQHKSTLESALGWRLDLREDLPTIVDEKTRPERLLPKAVSTILPTFAPRPDTGAWRSQQLTMRRDERLFANMLVLFEGIELDWLLLKAAVKLAAADNDRILALHMVDTPQQMNSPKIVAMANRFQEQCQQLGLVGEFVVEAGNHLAGILKRAVWSDLVFANLTHPPRSNPLDRLRSFWGPLIEQCSRPLLITAHTSDFQMSPILLAYDGSPKADEALFLAAYHADRKGHRLTVLTVQPTSGTENSDDILLRAKEYLENRGVTSANYLLAKGEVGPAIINTAKATNSNLILMGSFATHPALRLVRGSPVEYVLQNMTQSLLICQ